MLPYKCMLCMLFLLLYIVKVWLFRCCYCFCYCSGVCSWCFCVYAVSLCHSVPRCSSVAVRNCDKYFLCSMFSNIKNSYKHPLIIPTLYLYPSWIRNLIWYEVVWCDGMFCDMVWRGCVYKYIRKRIIHNIEHINNKIKIKMFLFFSSFISYPPKKKRIKQEPVKIFYAQQIIYNKSSNLASFSLVYSKQENIKNYVNIFFLGKLYDDCWFVWIIWMDGDDTWKRKNSTIVVDDNLIFLHFFLFIFISL